MTIPLKDRPKSLSGLVYMDKCCILMQIVSKYISATIAYALLCNFQTIYTVYIE
jgi:hypothetical protein